MLYEITLLTLTLCIIWISVILIERSADRRYLKKYGASVDEFNHFTECIKASEFDKLPKPKTETASVYNDLLMASDAYLNAHNTLDASKQQLIRLSLSNRELINSYVKVLHLLKPSIQEPKNLDEDYENLSIMVREVNASIEVLTKQD